MRRFGITVSEYIKWLKNDKQIIFGFTLICLYMFAITPMKEYVVMFGEPVNVFEPYMLFISNILCVPVLALTFAVLMIDFPDISANATFVLVRAGRARWYRSQVGFLVMAAVTMLAALFVFGIIAITPVGFAANVWSNSSKLINGADMDLINFIAQNPFCNIELSVMNNFTVASGIAISSLLMLLHLTFSAQLQMALTLRFNKIVGLSVNLLVLGAGMALQMANVAPRWIFPFAHSTVGRHYDDLFNEVRFPVWGSVIYLLVANIFVYLLGERVIKKKILTLMNQGD